MIPKKIHYCWFGGKTLPAEVKKCIKSWKKNCPEYEIIEWNESNFDVNKYEFTKKAYKEKAWAFVSDYARLKIIYEHGGIYLDTDVELKKSLDDLLKYEGYFAIQQSNNEIATGLGFGAVKNSEVLKTMIDEYDKINFDPNKKVEIACPIINTKVIKEYCDYSVKKITIFNKNYAIFPPEFFDPICPGESENLLSDNSYSIHHYNASWLSSKTIIKRKIINFIGQNKINKLKKIIKRGKK